VLRRITSFCLRLITQLYAGRGDFPDCRDMLLKEPHTGSRLPWGRCLRDSLP
jgi:hypothetical protein